MKTTMTTSKAKPITALVTAGLLLTAMPLSALADSLNYNFWQLAYVSADIDGIPDKFDGWGVGGSVEVTDEIFLTAGYTDISADIGGYNISEQDLALSVGYAYPVAANTDVIGRVGYVRAELDAEDLGDDSDDGYSLGVGVRTRPLDPIELEANVYVRRPLGRGRHDQFRHRRVLVLHAAGGLRRDRRVQRRRGELQHRLPRHVGPQREARLTAAVCDPGKPPWPGAVHGSGLAHG